MPNLNLARCWTAEEAEAFRKPAPDFVIPVEPAAVGQDTEFAGDTTGGLITLCYAFFSSFIIALKTLS